MVTIHTSSPDVRALWDRLVAFEFDDPAHALSFTKRLALENNWTTAFAEHVIDEYRRFCFLALRAGHPVTPSDAVDQVWHLHLSYTRNYWDLFCPEVLGKPLHHDPTEGGDEEQGKYRDWYSKTLDSYRHYFGAPPAPIWPAVEKRFAVPGRIERIARVVSRTWILLIGGIAALFGVMALFNGFASGVVLSVAVGYGSLIFWRSLDADDVDAETSINGLARQHAYAIKFVGTLTLATWLIALIEGVGFILPVFSTGIFLMFFFLPYGAGSGPTDGSGETTGCGGGCGGCGGG